MLESRCLRSRRAFLDHHRPCSSITRRRRRRGGVRCRRRDAQWPCRPRLFEQYASTRRGDTDLHPRVLEWISIAIETFNPLCTWLWLRDSIILVRRVPFLPLCARTSVNVTSRDSTENDVANRSTRLVAQQSRGLRR